MLLLLLGCFCASRLPAQSAPAHPDVPQPAALLSSVKVVLEPDYPAVEITANRPTVPVIRVMQKPQRLVIDLDNAWVSESKWIRVQSKQVSGMRVSQFKTNPPIVRIVLDLRKPAGATWKAEGNVLTVHLGPKTEAPEVAKKAAPVKPPAPPAPPAAQAVKPAMIAPVPGTSGAVMESASRTGGGSSVYAGADTAIVHLPRGGEVRVCPGTTISVTYSQTGQDMMLGMSTGALEVHYRLAASSNDAVVTPDFRIMLPGPGDFHYAVSADSRGNTCVRALPGNASPVVVAELMGDGIYDVKPSQHVTFHSGRLASIAATVPPDCGCPEPGAQVMRAASQEPPAPAAADPGQQPAGAIQLAANMPQAPPLPESKPSEVHVQVDAPLVFRGDQLPPVASTPKTEVGSLPAYAQRPEPMEVMIVPPAAEHPEKPAKREKSNPSERRGFMGKLKGFFSGIFH